MKPLRVVVGCTSDAPPQFASGGIWTPPGASKDVQVAFVFADEAAVVRPGATLRGALADIGWSDGIDCYVAQFPEYRPLPRDVAAVARHIVFALGDWNVAGQLLHRARGMVDAVVCDHAGAGVIRALGYDSVMPSLMFGVEHHWSETAPDTARDIDVLFIGSINAVFHARRNRWLARLAHLGTRHRVVIRNNLYGDEYRRHFARARLVFNHSIRGEANIRAFEAPMAGCCTLNERDNTTLSNVFTPDEHYATYDASDLETVIDSLLANDDRRIAMATAGQIAARAHTVEAHLAQRIADIASWLRQSPASRDRPATAWASLLEAQWQLTTRADACAQSGEHIRRAGGDNIARDRVVAQSVTLDPASRGQAGLPASQRLVAGLPARQLTRDVLQVHGELLLAGGMATDAVETFRAAEHAPACRGVDGDWPAPLAEFSFWRTSLEAQLLDEPESAAAAALMHGCLDARARSLVDSAAHSVSLAPTVRLQLLGEAPPTAPAALIQQTVLLRDAGHTRDALAACQSLIDLSPLDTDVHLLRAHLLHASGQHEAACAALDEHATALASFVDLSADRERVEAELDRMRAQTAPPRTAWSVVDPADEEAVGRILQWRIDHPSETDQLVIATTQCGAGPGLVDAITSALADLAVDPDELPSTEIYGELDVSQLRAVMARADLVVTTSDSVVLDLARECGVPIIDRR